MYANAAYVHNKWGEWQEDGKNISRSVCTIIALSIESLPHWVARMRVWLEERVFKGTGCTTHSKKMLNHMSGVRSVKPLVSSNSSSSREIRKHWQVLSPPHTHTYHSEKNRPQWNKTLVLIALNWAMNHKQAQTESAAFFGCSFESAEFTLT